MAAGRSEEIRSDLGAFPEPRIRIPQIRIPQIGETWQVTPASSGTKAEDEAGSMRIPESPVEVLRINDAARRPDIGCGDLWTADELVHAGGMKSMPKTMMPVFGPSDWGSGIVLSQAEYSAEFKRRAPLAEFILQKTNEVLDTLEGEAVVVVAGGAAAAPYYMTGGTASDVDFFIAGVDPADRNRLWGVVECIFSVIRKIYDKEHPFHEEAIKAVQTTGTSLSIMDAFPRQILTPGLITIEFEPGYYSDRIPDLQIILRAYPSVSAIIHAFDIPSSCIAYDGDTAYMTTLGAYAHLHRVNIVNPAYRSTTYERRLIKYFKRGYALGLVDLDPDALLVGQKLELPHIVLAASSAKRDRWIEGVVTLPATAAPPRSDYTPEYNSWDEGETLSRAYYNTYQVANGKSRYALVRLRDEDSDAARDGWLGTLAWAEGGDEPMLPDLLSASDLDRIVNRVIHSACTNDGLKVKSLVRYLGMSQEEIALLAQCLASVYVAGDLGDTKPISAADALGPFVRRVQERYHRAALTPIEWWITQDPGRQYTASLNPCMEDPTEWYGEGRVNLGTPRGLPSLAPVEPVTYGDSCPLCLNPLGPGEPNSITLVCGHSFHWANQGDGCEGLSKWFGSGKTTCPSCRADDRGRQPEQSSDLDPRDYQIQLRVVWRDGAAAVERSSD